MALTTTTALALLATIATTQAQSAGYSLTGLGWLDQDANGNPITGSSSVASDISENGTVVGQSTTPSGLTEAFKWTSSPGMTGLGDLAGGSYASAAYGVNSDGTTIVGFGTTGKGKQAFTYSGTISGLGEWPTAGSPDEAFGVDSSGSLIVGYGAVFAGADKQAFRYDASPPPAWNDLGGLSTYGDDVAYAVAAPAGGNPVFVGKSGLLNSGNSAIISHAFRMELGVMQDLGTTGGFDFDSRANDLTSDGSTVVGASAHGVSFGGGPAESVEEAFVWDASSGMIGLGDLGPNTTSAEYGAEAFGISADGQVIVGNGTTAPGVREAFVYYNGTMKNLADVVVAGMGVADLAALGWDRLEVANAVSVNAFNVASIVGKGWTTGGYQEAFLATIEVPFAVPEPEMYGLVAGGALLGLVVWRRRQRKSDTL